MARRNRWYIVNPRRRNGAEVEQHARAMAAALREVAKRPQQGYTSKGAFAVRLVSVQSIARAALAAWDAAEKGGEGRQ
jgi:hypothetical protein